MLPAAEEKLNPNDGKFVVGKDDWLFINNDTNGMMGQITGRKPLPPEGVDKWCKLLRNRREWMLARGIQYRHVCAPNKECIYADKLPDGIQLSERRPIRQILDALTTSGDAGLVLYPFDNLTQARIHRDTYPKGDSHWNWFGSYVAYRPLVQSLGIEPIPQDRIDFVDAEAVSDLSAKLGRKDIITRAKIANSRTRRTFNNSVPKIGNLQIYENDDVSLPTAILFRDSYAVQLVDYLGQHFRKITLVWQPNIDWGMVEREHPDFVIGVQAERFMTRLPDDVNGLTNEQNAAAKGNAA